MRTSTVVALAFLGLVACSGCLSFTKSQRECLAIIKDAGFDETEQAVKSPAGAAIGNVFIGIGNAYLASEEPALWFAFGLDLCTWPASIFWAVPQGAIDANVINKKATIDYYFNTERGRAELAAKRGARKDWTPR